MGDSAAGGGMGDLNLPQVPAKSPLGPDDIEEICQALVEAYDVEPLAQRIAFKWGVRLERKFDLRDGSELVFGRLVKWTEQEGRTRDLLAVAWTGKQDNRFLHAAAARLLPDLEAMRALYAQPNAGLRAPPVQERLEALVTERSRLLDYGQFMLRFARAAAAICKVEMPDGKSGTGFLIGRRHVLTNHHVVCKAISNLPLGEGIICRFDYQTGANGQATDGVPVGLAPQWLVESSPHSQSDVTGTGQPNPQELDFALLRLATDMPAARVPFVLPAEASIVTPGDVALIAQHPGGDPLSIAYGVITDFPASGLRYRYNITTEGGASGSPVLSADFDLIGLHHAAEPVDRPSFNQAVPLFLIQRLLSAKHDLAAL